MVHSLTENLVLNSIYIFTWFNFCCGWKVYIPHKEQMLYVAEECSWLCLLNHMVWTFYFIFFFFFFKFIYFSWRLITLQYCGGFCHTLIWISHGCTCVSHPSSHLPPHPIPLGHPSAPALSTLFHALNLDWRSVSYMILYMFQCCSLRSSHPHPLPESKRLLYTSVSPSLSRIQGYCYHLSKFDIYVLLYCLGVFL